MKKGIHPVYQRCEVSCVCGNNFITRSTVNSIKLEICSECHPFYVGKQRNTGLKTGPIEKFNKKYGLK